MTEPMALAVVRRHFNVCGVYDLCAYANCMPLLYDELKQQRRDRYNPHDRLVFLLYDLDFTLEDWTPGFTLYNLQLILQDLDISNYYALILTNRPDYDSCTRQVQRTLTSDEHHIRSITTFLDRTWIEPVSADPGTDRIQFPFSVLSRQSRPHRSYFVAKLDQRGLCGRSLVGYHNIPFPNEELIPPQLRDRARTPSCEHLGLISTPAASQRLVLRDANNQNVYKEFVSRHASLVNFQENTNINNKQACMMISAATPVQQALIYLGLETDVGLSRPHVSPISLRGITQRRPFLLVAAPGTLSILRNLGFHVYDEVWDTSYDEIPDFESRVESILDIMMQWHDLTAKELQDRYREMQHIANRNYEFYTQEFESQQQHLLDLQLKNNARGL